jgi:hypothetical protein
MSTLQKRNRISRLSGSCGQSIVTKYLAPTDSRDARIKATCDRGSITVYYPDELSGLACHVNAARALVARFIAEDLATYGTPRDKNPWARPMQYLDIGTGYAFGWPQPVNT